MGRRPTRSARGGLARGGPKGGLKKAFDAEVVAEIEALVGPGAADGLDFEAIETAARRRALAVAARAVERRINADRSEHAGPTLPCACGKLARYAGRRPKTFATVLGEMTLERAYYHCDPCDSGFCPRDRALGIEGTSLSPRVTRMVGLSAAMVSFAESSELMHELAGVGVDAKQVERTAEALGREIAQDERAVVEPAPPSAPTMYLGMDTLALLATGVPTRASELEGRAGKQPDGSAKTREVKLVTLWSAEGRRAVLGDGAKWIWNLATEHFPDAVQIVDRFHAKHHLSDVAKSIYGAGSDLGEQWARERHDELDAGDVEAVLRALRVHASQDDEARKCLDYVDANRERMRYAQFRAAGLCTSTRGLLGAARGAADRRVSLRGACSGPMAGRTCSGEAVGARS